MGDSATVRETPGMQPEEWAKHERGKDDHVPEQGMLEK